MTNPVRNDRLWMITFWAVIIFLTVWAFIEVL